MSCMLFPPSSPIAAARAACLQEQRKQPKQCKLRRSSSVQCQATLAVAIHVGEHLLHPTAQQRTPPTVHRTGAGNTYGKIPSLAVRDASSWQIQASFHPAPAQLPGSTGFFDRFDSTRTTIPAYQCRGVQHAK